MGLGLCRRRNRHLLRNLTLQDGRDESRRGADPAGALPERDICAPISLIRHRTSSSDPVCPTVFHTSSSGLGGTRPRDIQDPHRRTSTTLPLPRLVLWKSCAVSIIHVLSVMNCRLERCTCRSLELARRRRCRRQEPKQKATRSITTNPSRPAHHQVNRLIAAIVFTATLAQYFAPQQTMRGSPVYSCSDHHWLSCHASLRDLLCMSDPHVLMRHVVSWRTLCRQDALRRMEMSRRLDFIERPSCQGRGGGVSNPDDRFPSIPVVDTASRWPEQSFERLSRLRGTGFFLREH